MSQATIQGPVLEWALEDAGVDRDQLLEELGLSHHTKHNGFLSGPVTVNEEGLERLAKATRRSVFFFAMPSPPSIDHLSVDANFRAPASNGGLARALNTEERAALRDAKRRQQAAAKIGHELGHEIVKLPTVSKNAAPELAASEVATWLDWGDRQTRRKQAQSKTQLFVRIRTALEARGIMTNLLPIEGDSLRGFTLHHDYVPLIFVNSSTKQPAARSFTLLHEFAHLLRGIDKACDKHDLQSHTSEEAWCNRFAAAFLMPKEDLEWYVEKQLKTTYIQATDIESVRRISGYFYCSYYSAAIRLKQIGLAHPDLVSAVSGGFEEPFQTGFPPGGQTRAQKRLSAFGSGLARLLDDALQKTSLSEIEVRKTLNLKSHDELQSFFALGREAE